MKDSAVGQISRLIFTGHAGNRPRTRGALNQPEKIEAATRQGHKLLQRMGPALQTNCAYVILAD